MSFALRLEPDRAASQIDRLSPERSATQMLRGRLALVESDCRTAAALLAELPAPSSRREAVERSMLLALSVLDREVETANRHVGTPWRAPSRRASSTPSSDP